MYTRILPNATPSRTRPYAPAPICFPIVSLLYRMKGAQSQLHKRRFFIWTENQWEQAMRSVPSHFPIKWKLYWGVIRKKIDLKWWNKNDPIYLFNSSEQFLRKRQFHFLFVCLTCSDRREGGAEKSMDFWSPWINNFSSASDNVALALWKYQWTMTNKLTCNL